MKIIVPIIVINGSNGTGGGGGNYSNYSGNNNQTYGNYTYPEPTTVKAKDKVFAYFPTTIT